MKYASPKRYFSKYQNRLIEVLEETISSDQLILGQQVKRFENVFAEIHSMNYCIGVNSCTDALTMCLKAADIGAGDEVITTAITAPATIVSILNSGATPVIVDVEAPTYCISTSEVENAISSKTKAVVPVHLHGFPADMKSLVALCSTYRLKLIEDCAQASGALYENTYVGNFGEAAAFSFYPTKNLACLGDGGAVLTNDESISERVRCMRFYGFDDEGMISEPGLNSRMDELQAAFLNVLIVDLIERNESRNFYASRYHEHLLPYKQFLPPLIEGAVYHQFSLRVPRRDKFVQQLSEKGLDVGVHYRYCMQDHPAFQKYCRKLPLAQKVVNEFVSIPIQPEILDDDFEEIVSILLSCLKHQ